MRNLQIKGIGITIILLLFILVEEYFAVAIWFVFLGMGILVANKLSYSSRAKEYFIAFYLIFSLVGLVLCLDNLQNFNELFGFAGDDKRFFESVMYLIGNENKPAFEISIYAYFLYPIAILADAFKPLSIVDLLIFNWFVSGLIAVLLNEIAKRMTGAFIPIWLLILSYAFCFIISDSFTRLYRDSLLMLFILLSFNLLLQKHSKKAILSIIPVFLLRMGNTLLPLLFFLTTRFKLRKKRYLLGTAVLLLFVTITFLPNIIKLAMIYGSDYSRLERYESAFMDLENEEIYDIRFQENQSGSSDLMAQAYTEVSFSALIIRAAFGYFYPLRFKSLNSEVFHSRLGFVKGTYFYHGVNWLFTISLVVVFPLLIIGVLFNTKESLNRLIITQTIFLLLILLISGQTRHLIGAFIFNPILANNGLLLIQNNTKYKQTFYSLSAMSGISILFYNVFY